MEAFEDDTQVNSKVVSTADIAPVVVIDNGTQMMKVGISSRKEPLTIFPTVSGTTIGMRQKKGSLVGRDAICQVDVRTCYPIQYGIIVDWVGMQSIWQSTFFNVLKMDPSMHPVLLTENPLNPRAHREKMCTVMFEAIKVHSLITVNQSVLAMYAFQRTTGTVIDFGAGVTDVASIYEGYAMPLAITRYMISGNDLTEYLTAMIEEKQGALSARDRRGVEDMKATLCFVAEEYHKKLQESAESDEDVRTWRLPSFREIVIKEERFKCGEALFRPELMRKKLPGIHETVHSVISKCEPAVQTILYSNILLAGGGSLLSRLARRLRRELSDLTEEPVKVFCADEDEAPNAVYYGGVLFASAPSFQSAFVHRAEFEEHGASIIHKRCI
eukprot:gnl/MRDRNA2_/MRDRNA2_34516_c0_seq1.p1 gnl/MRDRNA2_/MRDRNA2_34516_c0~~gnl/MRDRNA2_/MRDRNA2_34516_c0_seq1.p1  ORF type:complete len:385 (-),score=52.02 gnl/MRDRNA2_/MRDRNA2_34516_c0_seq1:177-1331(-)